MFSDTVYGFYDSLGTVPYYNIGSYIDNTTNPAERAARYKISAVDSCDYESELSDYHKTIHLTINQGLNGYHNLIWDDYEGVEFSFYRIYRTVSDSMNQPQLIAEIQNSLYSFTDTEPVTGLVNYYIVEAVPRELLCDYFKKSKGTVKSSFSNIVSMKATGLNEQDNNLFSCRVYPNPATDISNISYLLQEKSYVNISLVDITGRELLNLCDQIQLPGYKHIKLNTSIYNKGMYFLKFRINDRMFIKKVNIL